MSMRKTVLKPPFLKRLAVLPERMQAGAYPFDLPILEEGRLAFDFERSITFFVGDNGTGKSTLLEAIARQCGFGVRGGSRNQAHRDGDGQPDLAAALRLSWLPKVATGFFLRAESFFDFASYIDELGPEGQAPYGGKSLHAQSHGQSFFALFETVSTIAAPPSICSTSRRRRCRRSGRSNSSACCGPGKNREWRS
jgi:predicted ATPase